MTDQGADKPMTEPSNFDPVENLVLDRIVEILGVERKDLVSSDQVIAAIRKVLASPNLAPREKDLIRRLRTGGDEGLISDGLISLRLERALSTGLEAASRKTGQTVTSALPRIVVLGETSKATPETLHEQVASTLEMLEDEGQGPATQPSDAGPQMTLVFQETEVEETLLEPDDPSAAGPSTSGPTSATGPSRSGLASLGGASRSGFASLGGTSKSGIALCAVSGHLKGLRSRLDSLAEGTGSGDRSFRIGQTLAGKYCIDRMIGKGGFGAVYEATDNTLGSKVAIKVLNARSATDTERDAFREEARRVTRLKHPNIVDWKVFEQQADGSYYFVMEFLDGEELGDILKRETRLDPKRAATILLDILSALRSAHHVSAEESILHLDLKPQNVFLVRGKGHETERVKVIDFGLGLMAGNQLEGGDDPEPDKTTADSSTLRLAPGPATSTGTGSATGSTGSFRRSRSCTPAYASPEQSAHFAEILERRGIFISNRTLVPLDCRSDLYSFGLIGFAMLTGERPWDEDPKTPWEWLRLHCDVPPKKLAAMRVPGVSRALARFIDRCLVKDREQRWKDTHEAYHALHDIVHPPVWKTVARVTIPLLIVAALVIGYIASTRPPERFDLRARAGTSEVDLATTPLYFGPGSPARTIVPVQPPGDVSRSPLRLVTSLDRSDAVLTGFVARAEGQEVEIRVAGRRDPYRGLVHLELEDGGRDRFSRPFRLIYLPENSWSLLPLDIESLREKSLDPVGRKIEVRVDIEDEEDVDSILLTRGEKIERARFEGRREGVALFGAAVDPLGLVTGAAEITVRALDKAGSSHERKVTFSVAGEPLSLSGMNLETERRTLLPSTDGTYDLFANTSSRLVVTLNGKGDLRYRILDEESRKELAAGASTGERVHRIDLSRVPDLREDRSAPYRGRIEIEADDAAYVSRTDPGRGRLPGEAVRFHYRVDPPELEAVRLLVPDRRPLEIEDGATVYSPSREVSLALTRRFRSSLQVAIRAEDAGKEAVSLPARILQGAINPDEAVFDLGLPGDGVYRVHPVIRLVSESGEPSPGEEAAPSYTLVVDTSAPGLELSLASSGKLVTASNPSPGSLGLRILDTPLGQDERVTPVSLSWRITRRGASGREVEIPLSSALPGTVTTLSPLVCDLHLPWEDRSTPEADHDGVYRLEASGTDAAGNVARSGSVSFTVSLQGPRAELLEPGATSPTWERGSGGLWDLRLRSADRNGTASVEATIAATGAGAPVPLVLDLLRREGSDEVDTVWESSLRLGPDWSTREVEIRIRAQDGAGTEAEVTRQCRLPEIREEHPRLLAVTRRDEPGAPIAPMRLVPGNRDGNYRFHGRGDSIENEQFQRSQIELRTLTWSWDVEFQKDEISDYYLDEHEVTCGEYLAFVRSRTGFADPSLWPRDAEGNPDIPPAPRREEIEKALSSRPADLPVTLVSWAEAWAYARWVGKRLPSFVEWEVAVRGGAQYRPYASFRPDVPRDKDELNFDHRTGSPWPVGRGIDVTPDTGIRNLDTNVMEWTRTPASLTGGGDSSAREEARARPLLFAAQEQEETPAAGSRLYHAVGGHYASSTADASKSDAFDRDERMPYLGFRCAVSARHVARAREGSVDTTLSPVLYRALGPEDASRRSAIDE